MAKSKEKKEKKGKGKGKKGKEPASKQYKLLTTEEMRAREMRHTTRLGEIKAARSIVEEALLEVNQRDLKYNVLAKWERYLVCDGLPRPYCPPDIRLFFVKLRFFEAENVEKSMNWLLSVNERSILSQDIFRKDLTRKTLINEIRPNLGLEYDKNVDLGLAVLKSIEYYLDDDNMVMGASNRVLHDIKDQKNAVQQEISQFFDRFAYRILCSEDAYMEQLDAVTSEYYYEANNFQIHIWTLKQPILFDYASTPSIIAQLHKLGIDLQLPFSLLKEDLALRGLHLNFDHFSEHAKSFEQEIHVPVENLNAGISDLYECLINEWVMQLDIQDDVRNMMIGSRQAYEEKIRLIEEEANSKGKKKLGRDGEKSSKKGPKIKKPGKEPPVISDDVYPDVWEDFLEKEQKQFIDFMNVVFEPNVLQLTKHEINLKKYLILGGIYQLYVVSKPKYTNFNTFNMTWHGNNGNLFIHKDVKANLHFRPDEDKLHRRTLDISMGRKSRRPTVVDVKHARATVSDVEEQLRRFTMVGPSEEDNDQPQRRFTTKMSHGADDEDEDDSKFTADPEISPYFIITFTLPAYLCLWGEPIACHFEADIKGMLKPKSSVVPASLQSHPSRISMRNINSGSGGDDSFSLFSTGTANTQLGTSTHTVTSNMEPSVASTDEMNALRAASSANLFRPSLSHLSVLRAALVRPVTEYENFDLNMPLTKVQIRNLQRHCVPRIISSYKFPIEVEAAKNEESRNKPKGQGGTLVRKHVSDEELTEVKAGDRIYTYLTQHDPERIFPLFPKNDPITIPRRPDEEIIEMVGHYEPETFYELIQTLNSVKQMYRTKYERTVEVPSIVVPVVPKDRSMHNLAISSQASDDGKKTRKSVVIPRKSSASGRRKSSKTRKKRQSRFTELDDGDKKECTFSHWTREHIFHSLFDRENCKFTIWTDRLGNIGFAYKRYEHFPFRSWSIAPSENDPENEVVFTLETQYAKCIIYITEKGFHGYVTDFATKYVRNPVIYLEIKEPLKDLKELKKRFQAKNINIFSEHDARFYIENGYFSEKHVATELHIYSNMAIHAAMIKFKHSQWNRLANRRDIVLYFAQNKELEENMCLVRITPENATFVDVKELCSPDLNVFNLEYTPTWRNIDHYCDLHHQILSVYPSAIENRVKDASLICCLKNLLCEIRPLSYC